MWGRCPLHHVVGVVHVPLAPALRYSSRVIQNPLRTPLNFKAARARLLSLCYILPPASAAFPCVHSFPCLLASAFFFLEFGRCRTVARSLHENKQSQRHLYKDPEGPEVQANHSKPKTTQKTTRRPANSPARFAFRQSKQQTRHTKGQEPKQQHPQKGFAKGHSGLTTVSHSKTCQKK